MIKHIDQAFNVIYGYRCNYSCIGCCNGSDYVTIENYDPDIDLTIESIKRLPDLIEIPEEGMITLLGGEPLMYWKERIIPLARTIREAFPTARINIFSNGHLVNKHIDSIIEVLDTYRCHMTISQHLLGDMNSPLGKKWRENVDEFLTDPRIVKIHDQHYHVSGNIAANIFFYNADEWFTWYQQTPNGDIKPWATQDPEGSMKHGCASGNTCSALFENRLYKCGSLAMLPGFLTAKNQINDIDWKKYLDYPYVDVLDVDPSRFRSFVDTYGKPIPECDMCNNQKHKVIKWTGRTQNMVIQRK